MNFSDLDDDYDDPVDGQNQFQAQINELRNLTNFLNLWNLNSQNNQQQQDQIALDAMLNQGVEEVQGIAGVEERKVAYKIKKVELPLPRPDTSDISNQEEIRQFIDDLVCPICLNLIENPMCCIGCEVNFCSECIKSWQQSRASTKCPTCRNTDKALITNGQRVYYKKSPIIFKRIIESVYVKCHNTGCTDTMKCDQRRSHVLNACQYQEIDCTNEGCDEPVIRINFSDHLEVCEYRRVKCIHCQELYPKIYLNRHIEQCKFNQRMCINCMSYYQAKEYLLHRYKCNKKCALTNYPTQITQIDNKFRQRLMYKALLLYDNAISTLPIDTNLLHSDQKLLVDMHCS